MNRNGFQSLFVRLVSSMQKDREGIVFPVFLHLRYTTIYIERQNGLTLLGEFLTFKDNTTYL
ncbi:hypothetical protein J2S03_001742 [Alicyclobacillus cycloheptanicus]|uniref:Uncharacterized protein n=1 Tax=Alicyclobacillus cycloheptanicus TaxID=1457 RepID=A0ABT9XHT9_9BACL|nr:hypothetical protein [Alicyclobacillus cycloheptanicus]